MGNGRRLATVTGALAAAAVLWPASASAGTTGPPDQEAKQTFYVEVTTFITCQVDVHTERYGSNAFVTTQVMTDVPECRQNEMTVYGEFTGTDGGSITASSGGSGGIEAIQVGGVARINRTIHAINFDACSSCSQSVELHPK